MAEGRSKRERKSTEFFNPVVSPKLTGRTTVGQGTGLKLGDIPNVSFKLDKLKGSAELLENFHQIIFKSKGKAHSRKKDIKSFSGFAFEANAKEAELDKFEMRLGKWTTNQLNSLLDLLDLSRGSGEDGVKDKKIERLKDFLLKPAIVSEKDLGAQAAQKKEKKERGKAAKARKEAAVKKASSKKEAQSPKPKAVTKAGKSPAQEGGSSRKRKAAASEEKPAKKAKKVSGKRSAEESVPAPKPWPPAKDVKADVEFIFQTGLDKGEEMTMGKIYAELATKYGFTTEEIKTKKAQIKDVVKDYEAQLDTAHEPVDAAGEDGDPATADAPQAMDTDAPAAPVSEEVAVVMDKATSEGDEHQDTQAVETDAGGPKQPEGTEDIQPAVPEPVKEAPSTEAQATAGGKEVGDVVVSSPPPPLEPPPVPVDSAKVAPGGDQNILSPASNGLAAVPPQEVKASLQQAKANGVILAAQQDEIRESEERAKADAVFDSLEDL